jgi:hypothetical protein
MSSAIPEGATGPGPEDHSEYIPDTNASNASVEPNNIPDEIPSTTPLSPTPDTITDGNPAWNPFREKLPASLFNEVRPELDKWDKNYQQVQQQFAPYKSFAEQGVPPETIQKAMQLAQVLNANPRAVWEELNSRYNFGAELSGQGQQEQQKVDEDGPDEYDPDAPFDLANVDLTKNPQFKAWQEQTARQEEYLQNQRNAEIQRETQAELDSQWSEVKRLNGRDLNQQEQLEVIRRANWIADMKDQQTGKPGYHEPDLREGYRDYAQFVQQVRGTRANNTAPDVLGGTGGVPAPPKGITADMSDDERTDYIVARLRQLKPED